jgi:hypothetical protein
MLNIIIYIVGLCLFLVRQILTLPWLNGFRIEAENEGYLAIWQRMAMEMPKNTKAALKCILCFIRGECVSRNK